MLLMEKHEVIFVIYMCCVNIVSRESVLH